MTVSPAPTDVPWPLISVCSRHSTLHDQLDRRLVCIDMSSLTINLLCLSLVLSSAAAAAIGNPFVRDMESKHFRHYVESRRPTGSVIRTKLSPSSSSLAKGPLSDTANFVHSREVSDSSLVDVRRVSSSTFDSLSWPGPYYPTRIG